MRCGVLALQGDYDAHAAALRAMGVGVGLVRTAAELAAVDALVLPGGESSTMLRLLAAEGMTADLRARLEAGMPTLATCAGVILLARVVEPPQESLGALDVVVRRNAYGRQVHSAVAEIAVLPPLAEPATMEAVFIRAPRVLAVGAGVEVLGRWGDDPVLLRQGRILGATFHPELTRDRRLHRLFAATWG